METYGAHWNVEKDPMKLAKMIIEKIEQKRELLGINKKQDRVLFDMEMRRDLEGGEIKGVGCSAS